MNKYPQRVADNILPLSISKSLTDAFKEWYFTERSEDHEEAIENCELCNHEQLRYQFEIQNKNTKECLWVGSSCILKFKVAVFDDGVLLDEKKSEKKLNALIRKMQLDSCIKALEALSSLENNDILKNALDYYNKNKYLTPKFAFVVFWKLNEKKIDYHPSFFKISLKKNSFKKDLEEMPLNRVQMFWSALTSSQREIAIKFGHKAPKN
jgi:hypothetical protein